MENLLPDESLPLEDRSVLPANVRVMQGLQLLFEIQDVLGLELTCAADADIIRDWRAHHADNIINCILHHQLHSGPSTRGLSDSYDAMTALSEEVIDDLRVKLGGSSSRVV